MRNIFIGLLATIALSLLSACGGGNASSVSEGNRVKLDYARLIDITELQPGVRLVSMKNPWDTTKIMSGYALVDRKINLDSINIPAHYVRIPVPVRRAVVFSSLHMTAISELGAAETIIGITEPQYVNDSVVKLLYRHGKIADCGLHNQPNVELILTLKPDVVIVSPYETSNDAEKFARTGIPVLFAADYMEPDALGRAEWIRLFGLLYGKSELADSLSKEVIRKYNCTKHLASTALHKPVVLFDRPYQGVWDVPTGGSVTGKMITDAGGVNPFAYLTKGGSGQLTAEEVLLHAQDADIWLIRYLEPRPLTYRRLADENNVFTKFRAYKNQNIFMAHTLNTTLFDDAAFHPEKILEELTRLIHPELYDDGQPLRYYEKVKTER